MISIPDEDPPTVEKKMIQLLSSGKFKKEEIVDLWRVFIDDENNLKRALNDVTIVNDQSIARAGSNVSLVRMFLQIPAIQTAVSNHLLQKLNEAVLVALVQIFFNDAETGCCYGRFSFYRQNQALS